MDLDKEVGDYCNNDGFDTAKVQLYNVIELRICREITKYVTFTESIKTVQDLRKYLIFSEVEQFGEGKFIEENDDFKKYFRFTYDFSIIAEDINLRELMGENKSSRQ